VGVRSFTIRKPLGTVNSHCLASGQASLQFKGYAIFQLKTLGICNLGGIPPPVLITSVQYLQLNNITTMPLDASQSLLASPDLQLPLIFEAISPSYINARTVSMVNNKSTVILDLCMDLNFIQ